MKDETKKKISDSLKGHDCYRNPERGKNISNALKNAYKNGTKTQYSGKVSTGKRVRMMYKGKRISKSNYIFAMATGHWVTKNEVIHHKDFNQSNDSFNKLQLMTRSEHIKLHTAIRVNGNK